MTCANFNNRLQIFKDGSLFGPEELANCRAIQEHAQKCQSCNSQHAEDLETIALIVQLKQIETPDPGPLYWQYLPTKIRKQIEEQRSTLGLILAPILSPKFAWAALAVLILGLSIPFRNRLFPPADDSRSLTNNPMAQNLALDFVNDSSAVSWNALGSEELQDIYAHLQESGFSELATADLDDMERATQLNFYETAQYLEQLSDVEIDAFLSQLETLTL